MSAAIIIIVMMGVFALGVAIDQRAMRREAELRKPEEEA